MRDWLVGGGVIEAGCLGAPTGPRAATAVGAVPAGPSGPPIAAGPRSVLLVENVRRNGTADWTPPGGVIDAGEDLLAGLTREVAEETGLVIEEWVGPVYEIEAEAPGLGWRLRVEVHRAVRASGAVRVGEDPDGIVVGAGWFAAGECPDQLAAAHPWVREPLLDWLDDPWDGTRTYRYRVAGDHPDRLRIERR